MKPRIEKLPLSENTSFVARTHKTPRFEVPWHQHIELELILFTEGEGTAYIGNYVGTFGVGDVYFLGANLPHTFQKAQSDMVTSAVVIHFREDFWGSQFLQIPESREIRTVFEIAGKGLKITGKTREILSLLIPNLEKAKGFQRVLGLCTCLNTLVERNEYETVSTQELNAHNPRTKERIDKIFQYTIDNFQDEISLSAIASYTGMSVPAFCHYFKKSTKKTYINFLHDVRIGHACKLLMDTQDSIEMICYQSGFNTLANFNRQFQKVKHTSPSGFRKKFMLSQMMKI